MIRNHLAVSCVAGLLGAAAWAEEPALAQAEPSTAVHLHLGAPVLSSAPVIMGGGLGWIGAAVPSAGLELERVVAAHWAVVLGVSADFTRASTGDLRVSSVGVSLEPGLRWYPGSGRMTGGFVSASVPLSWSSQASPQWNVGALAAGASVMLGWALRTDSGLTASLGVGPTARLARTFFSGGEVESVSVSGGVALRGAASVGFAF